MLSIQTETIPGYPETRVKTEIVVGESSTTATRVIDSTIYSIEIQSFDLKVIKKVLELSNIDFKMFGSISIEP